MENVTPAAAPGFGFGVAGVGRLSLARSSLRSQGSSLVGCRVGRFAKALPPSSSQLLSLLRGVVVVAHNAPLSLFCTGLWAWKHYIRLLLWYCTWLCRALHFVLAGGGGQVVKHLNENRLLFLVACPQYIFLHALLLLFDVNNFNFLLAACFDSLQTPKYCPRMAAPVIPRAPHALPQESPGEWRRAALRSRFPSLRSLRACRRSGGKPCWCEMHLHLGVTGDGVMQCLLGYHIPEHLVWISPVCKGSKEEMGVFIEWT